MKVPVFLKKKMTIGVVAPSFGISGDPYTQYYVEAKKQLQELGHTIIECPSIYQLEKGQSNTPEIRAQELMDFYLNDAIDCVWSCAGGEIMNEILPYIPFEKLKKAKPKWFIGYSDNTNFTMPLATHSKIMSVYDMVVPEFGTRQSKVACDDLLSLIQGKKKTFKQYGEEPTLTLNGKDVMIEGYLLGGCFDVLTTLLGTDFDQIPEFIKSKKGQVILYLETCEYNVLGLKRCLWQLQQLGYLDHIQGLVLGKMRVPDPVFGVSLQDALLDLDLPFPILYNVEIGHTYPTLPMVNGCYAKVAVKKGCFSIKYDFDKE